MDDVKAMLEIKVMLEDCQKRMDDVLDNIHRRCDQLQQAVVLTFCDLQERLDATFTDDIQPNSAIFQEMIQESADIFFSQPPPRMSAPPMMQPEQDSLPVILEEHLPTFINSWPTITKDVSHKNLTQINEPSMQVEYDFVLSSSITKIKSDYDVVFDEIYSCQYVVKPLPITELAATKLATTKFATTKFATREFAATKFATTEFAMNDERTSKILVFDPGGISFIYMGPKTCIVISRNGLSFFSEEQTTRTSFLKGEGYVTTSA